MWNAEVPLKNELVQRRQLQNQAERQMAIVDDIDRFYTGSVCIRRSAIGVQTSSSGKSVVPNSCICYSRATSA